MAVLSGGIRRSGWAKAALVGVALAALTATFVARGYADEADSGELITNGKFAGDKLKPWWSYGSSAALASGALKITVPDGSKQVHDAGAGQCTTSIVKGGKYTFSFEASASKEVKVLAQFQHGAHPWPTAGAKEFAVTTTKQRYSFSFTSDVESAQAQVIFTYGGQGGFTLTLDNVSLKGPKGAAAAPAVPEPEREADQPPAGAVPPVAPTQTQAPQPQPTTAPPADPLPGKAQFAIFRERQDGDFLGMANQSAGDFGVKPASFMWFQAWGTPYPVEKAKALRAQGITPHMTWELFDTTGNFEEYVKQAARDMKSVGGDVMIRPGHEFNGDWYPWSVAKTGENPQVFIQRWRKIHDLIRGEGATNVKFIWCFNNTSKPDKDWNDPAKAYPGDKYVDWVGFDMYNWGGGGWKSFDALAGPAYAKAQAIAPNKPVMIGEMSSDENGGSKGQWWTDMFNSLASGRYPNLKMFTIFDIMKEKAWSIKSSPSSEEAFKAGLKKLYD